MKKPTAVTMTFYGVKDSREFWAGEFFKKNISPVIADNPGVTFHFVTRPGDLLAYEDTDSVEVRTK